jgi:hypothetical protein
VIAVQSDRMNTILSALVSVLSFRFRSRASLELELVALRHQLIVLRRQRPRRLRFHSADRLLWVCLYRVWPRVLDALVLVKPATVVKWDRQGFRIYWRWRSRRSGRPKTSAEIRALIRQMSRANPLWGHLFRGHPKPDPSLARAAIHGGLSVGHRTSLSATRPRYIVWYLLPKSCPSDGN